MPEPIIPQSLREDSAVGEGQESGKGRQGGMAPTIEFALILHRLKFIDGMLRRLLRPRPRAASRVPSERSVSFPGRHGGRNDPSPRLSTARHTTPLANFLPFRPPLPPSRASVRQTSFFTHRRGPYTFSTFVMFSANSPGNFSNKIRVPAGRLTSSRVRHRPVRPALLLSLSLSRSPKRRCCRGSTRAWIASSGCSDVARVRSNYHTFLC